MAVTTIDQLVGGAQPPLAVIKQQSTNVTTPRFTSTWFLPGIPGVGVADSTLNGATLTAPVQGAIKRSNPSSGLAYVNRLAYSGTQNAYVILADRLWHNGGITITSTSTQNITSPTWPARDLSAGTTGIGVRLICEVEVGTGTGTPTITVSYTNTAGTSGRTGTNETATTSNSALGHAFLISLEGNDRGVKSVESITLSATWTSGTIHLAAYVPVLSFINSFGYGGVGGTAFSEGLPQVRNDSVLFFLSSSGVTSTNTVHATYSEVHG